MNTTGIVRTVDNLGRIVLPIELRRTLDIAEKDSLEIYGRLCGDMVVLHGKRVCADCRRALAGLSPLQGG